MEEAEVGEIGKDKEPYGPWLVVSYEKKRIGDNNLGNNVSGKVYRGISGNIGKKIQASKSKKTSAGSKEVSIERGSRFEILEDRLEEVDPDLSSSAREESKAFGALSDITNGNRGSRLKAKIASERVIEPGPSKRTLDKLSPKINRLGKV
ncbi:hypothetical protein ACOSQ4_014148 [Xanthoceras sorbifolium]